MKKLNIKDITNAMSRSEMRSVKGGCGGNATTWKCCWAGTTICSQCAGYGVCDGGAVLKRCGFYE